MNDEIAAVRALRDAGRHDEHREAACVLAATAPAAVEAQIEAAYGLDRAGDEQRAISHYDAAYRLGVPASERRHFLIGYGSTLRNVGRVEEAIAALTQALADDPDYPPFAAFLALALHDAGRPREAVSALLGCLLAVARPGALDGYERALGTYQRALSGSGGEVGGG